MGLWLLFTPQTSGANIDATFYLKTPTSCFVLDARGGLSREIENPPLAIADLYYFSDLPMPPSLSAIGDARSRCCDRQNAQAH